MSEWSEYNYDPHGKTDSGYGYGYGFSSESGSAGSGFYEPDAYTYPQQQAQGVYNYGQQAPGGYTYGQQDPTDYTYGQQAPSAYTYDQQNPGVSGFMTPSVVPDAGLGQSSGDFADEPPLLEELGINIEHIVQKTLAVLNPFRTTRADVAGDSDLAGPIVFCLAFGSLLLLVGKVHFNYIYGIGVLGCLAMYGLLTMMAMTPVHFTVIVSVLGYCILPIVVLSAMSIVVSLQGVVGNVCAAAVVVWCAMSASKLFITAFNMDHQQLLVAYPCSLLYAVFALLTVF